MTNAMNTVHSGSPPPSGGQEDIVLVMDVKQMRPACVLLQAVYGCGSANPFLSSVFAPHHWLLEPTPDMKRIKGTRAQFEALSKRLSARKAKASSETNQRTAARQRRA